MIYADYAATTPLDERVLEAMLPYFTSVYGNASSIHKAGRDASAAVEKARGDTAACLGADRKEIYFTSGGTESDNWALRGIRTRHIITGLTEHHAVLHTCRRLEQEGVRVTYLPVDRNGMINPADLEGAFTPETGLVSVMAANNEIGTIQPIRELARIAHAHGALFHTDAVQAAGVIPFSVHEDGVDMLSLSAHKFYGPKGVGLLYVRSGVSLRNLSEGGEQERGKRPGTLNTPGIVGLAKALALSCEHREEENARLWRLNAILRESLEKIPGAHLNGHPGERLPGNLNYSFEGISGESLLASMDLSGVCCSLGSACTAGTIEPSHVLRAIGLPDALAQSALRITLGRFSTEEEVLEIGKTAAENVARLRTASALLYREEDTAKKI